MLARSRKFQLGSMLVIMLSVSMWSGAGHAYTPEQQQACSGDAFRLCGSEIPDIERVTVCMIKNRSQLSAECRAHFRADPDASVTAVNDGRPLGIKPDNSRRQANDRPRRSRRDDD
jgi:hypothetical protein